MNPTHEELLKKFKELIAQSEKNTSEVDELFDSMKNASLKDRRTIMNKVTELNVKTSRINAAATALNFAMYGVDFSF